jgi:kynurenine formamidase
MAPPIDLSHALSDGMVTYPGLPGPTIGDHLSREASRGTYAAGTEFQIGRIDMVANTGTYLDTPFHRYEDGWDLADLELAAVADVPAVVVRARGLSVIEPEVFADRVFAGAAVLFDTGWDQHWGTDAYLSGHPFLTGDAATALVDGGARLVGIDSLNIDDTATGERPVHSLLLGADIPVVEHLTGLDRLPEHGARFFAVPVKVRGMGTFPVRAFALVD